MTRNVRIRGAEMRVLLSTYDSRGGVEPLAALAAEKLLLDRVSQERAPVPA